MQRKLVFILSLCVLFWIPRGQASFLGEEHLKVEDPLVLNALNDCIEKIKSKPSGAKLIERVLILWEEYLTYEPKALLRVECEEPQFSGEDTKSPVKDISTRGGTKIQIKAFDQDPVMKEGTSSRGDKILLYKKKKGLGEGIKIDQDGIVTIDLMLIWNDEKWKMKGLRPTDDEYEAFFREKGVEVNIWHEEKQPLYKDPSLIFRCPKGGTDVCVGEDQCVAFLRDGIVTTKKQPTKLFIVVAHELIHMKHFLEERVFICRIVKGLIEKADKDDACLQDICAFCGSPKTLPDKTILRNIMIGAVKEQKKFLELCRLASKHGIQSSFTVVTQLMDVDSLKELAYSCCKISAEVDLNLLKKFPEFGFVGEDRNKFKALITDFEERRTVIGPDCEGLTEVQIRLEFEEPIRFIYQDFGLSVPIQLLMLTLPFSKEQIEAQIQKISYDSAPPD